MVTSLPVAKTLNKYNSNRPEENDEEEKKLIDIELTAQKDHPEMMKILMTLYDHVYKIKTSMILLWITSLKITKS